jgi:hypothetical protein
MSEFDFRDYLSAIVAHYDQWWRLYTITDVEGKQQSELTVPFFDFGLTVQTIGPNNHDPVGARIRARIGQIPRKNPKN